METEVSFNALNQHAYAMKMHHATRLHYDLRLEWNGVLLSWALPDGPGCRAGDIRKAIEMEDHRVENLLFEGVHETGPIMLWDRGTWEPHLDSNDIESSLSKGVLRFTLHGERLKGGWTLARMNGTGRGLRSIWTLHKHADWFAESYAAGFVLEGWQRSAITGRTMEEIVRDWTNPPDKHKQQMRLF